MTATRERRGRAIATGLTALLLGAVAWAGAGIPPSASADGKPAAVAVPAATRAAVEAYLRAKPGSKDETAALSKALSALKDDVAVAAEALRTHDPLTAAKPGTTHGIAFESGGKTWEYSVRLPKGYDGKKRFPVLVLPDHGLVDPASGISAWEGSDVVDQYVLFRPVIVKYQEDESRFPKTPFLSRDEALARVMADAMTHLRLHFAVDADRFSMTGLSQAGFYTWYYAALFPDQFAGIVPESSGGLVVPSLIRPLAPNLAGMAVRILHTRGDRRCPYEHATQMRDAIEAAHGKVELITYEDSDYPGGPPELRHPGPGNLRLSNVMPWGKEQKRSIPTSFTRVLRHGPQGFEGRFRLTPPKDPTKPVTVVCSDEDGKLSCDQKGATYLVSPEDVVAKRAFRAKGQTTTPKGDVRLLLTSFKATGDAGRMVAAEIDV
jgi:hypothetical protein